ncbi:TPA: hypothetical protein EYP38_04660 [Candidatus Micrarchaeota archaeon]|nr:hypothetical protein [Candidatus Micrarchaeota archaeon]
MAGTVCFLVFTVLNPTILGAGPSGGVLHVLVAGVLIASTTAPFVLSSLAQNLMIAAYSKEKKQYAIRLIVILAISPFILWIFAIPYIVVALFSFIYGALADMLAGALSPFIEISAEVLSPWVTFFVLGEALYVVFRYNVFDWYMSNKKTSSLNLAESQYQVVYKNMKDEKERLWPTL